VSRTRPVAALALLALLAAAPAASGAWRAPCVPGAKRPVCTWWRAKATFIADGDTIRARIAGIRGVSTIRFTGINAMELTRYSARASRRRGACHAVAATAVVQHAIRRAHGRIRLAAQRPASQTGGRVRRSVYARIGGAWVDVARLVLDRGLALWLPNPVEWAHNLEYRFVSDVSAALHRGLYDPVACGVGPDQDLPLSATVNWDANGNDERNLNGEWVEVFNGGARDLPLDGWWVRDSWLDYGARHLPGYAFPAGARIPPGGAVRVHVGCGADTPTDFHWCRRSSAFENVTHDRRQLGDGGYLFDPQGDLRAAMIYPCLAPCRDPLQGAVRITVHPSAPELIRITNVGTGLVDLRPYLLELHVLGERDHFAWSERFGGGAQLAPGETMRISPGGRPADDTRLSRHLGRGAYVLADRGGALDLRSYADAVVDCVSWGSGRC
jgi:endonuclease YncB( thermonuclease family)